MSALAVPSGRRRTSTRRVVSGTAWWVGVVVVSIVTVAPLVWTIATSLKPAGEILGSSLRLVPEHATIQNYLDVFRQVPFARYFVNSTVLAVGGAITNLFFGGLAGYALAKLRFPGRGAVFATFLASMMIPSIVTLIPTFIVLRSFPLAGGNDLLGRGGIGLINSYAAVLVPYAAGPFAVFFMRQFFRTMPDELGEAARIDGASEFQIFLRIYLPLAKAGMAALAVLTFQAGWNTFLWPLIVLNDPKMMTVQVGLAGFVNNYATAYGPLMAGTVVASIPVLVVFLVAQRWVIEGVASSGFK